MNNNRYYLLTGAAGFLGTNICMQLLEAGCKVRALVLPNDKSVKYIPEAVEVVIGDLCDEASLEPFSPMEWLEEDISFSSVGRSSAVCRLLRRTSLCVFEWP